MSVNQQTYYQQKLAYETDAWDLATSLQQGEAIVVVDGRSAAAFEQAHIPGAINLPHRSIDEASTAALAQSPTYVCYCDGIGCNASTKTALKLSLLGFTVKELLGGLDWWQRDGYAIEGLAAQEGVKTDCGCAG